MKTTLPAKSKIHQDVIKEIADIILEIGGKDKIAFIILFGSFARGTYVQDRYIDEGIIYEYSSDYDILVITKTGKQAALRQTSYLDHRVRKEFERRGLNKMHSNTRLGYRLTLVIESIDEVNSELEKGRYFFSDIKKEGILLYSSGEFELSEPKKLSEEEAREILKEDYELWYSKGKEFLIDCQNCLNRQNYAKSAFELHQATESFYHCTLLVITGYKHKTHDLEDLSKLCAAYSNEFLTVFPKNEKVKKRKNKSGRRYNMTKEELERLYNSRDKADWYELLRIAYIEARYNKYYKISKEQLEYLTDRVERLREVTVKVGKSRIDN